MLPTYKNDRYYQNFVGKCFCRETNSEVEYEYYKILNFNFVERMYSVEHCYCALGHGYIDKCKMYYSFVDMPNFVEITYSDYLVIKSLCL